jgi:hypothetical protein
MAGTATAVTNGDLIPLLDDNGSGQFVKGRNNIRDFRVGLLSSLFLADGTGVTPRDGVLMGVGGTGALKVNAQGSPNQTVLIGKGSAIVNRTGQGPYLFVNEVDQTVNMPAASGANTRYDIVCAWAADQGAFVGDTAHGPQFWVEQGALGGGVPATPAGMVKLAEVFRAVNDNTISAEIVDKRKSTVVSGVPRRIGPGDLTTDPGFLIGEVRDTGTSLDYWTGTDWIPLGDYASKRLIGKTTRSGSNVSYVPAGTVATVPGITFTPKAGHFYRLGFAGDYSGTGGSAMGLQFRSVAGGGPITTGSTARGSQRTMPVPNGLTQSGSTSVTLDAGVLGTSQVTVGFSVNGLAGNTGGTVNIGFDFTIEDLGL